MRVAVIHNLRPGGARRRLTEQIAQLEDVDLIEVCLETATPVTDDAVVVALRLTAPRAARALRPLLRHTDLGLTARAWRTAAAEIRRIEPDVVYANPCQFLQAPAALPSIECPSLYFCDEPRRADYDEAARSTRSRWTAMPYWPLRRAERLLDRRSVAAATSIATNSLFTARQIHSAYSRDATVLPMGVPDAMLAGDHDAAAAPAHVLSVGALIPSKGHDLVLRSVARSRARRSVVIVTPRREPPEAARLTELADGLGIDMEIRVGISDDDLTALYRTAFATCYLARGEPLGLASLEAQSCGSPVIVAGEGGLPETVLNQSTGFVVARREAAAAEALDALDDPILRDRLAADARRWGRQHTWKRSARALRQMLDDLVATRPQFDRR